MSVMRFTLPEILKAVSDAPTHAKKVSILQNCQSEVLEQVLQYNFHPDLKMNLPEGDAPYKKEIDVPVGKSASNLYREGRRLYLFLVGQAPNLKPYRREQLFIELLEGIHWTEADMLIAVKDKRLTDLYPGVTYESVRDAFDRILPQTPPKKVDTKPVKLAVPDIDLVLTDAAANKEEGDRPLDQPATSPKAEVAAKPKAVYSEARLAGLAKAREARKANAAAKRAALEASKSE